MEMQFLRKLGGKFGNGFNKKAPSDEATMRNEEGAQLIADSVQMVTAIGDRISAG
jgi:hypothetical protein